VRCICARVAHSVERERGARDMSVSGGRASAGARVVQ
jgi:hypothetical protein